MPKPFPPISPRFPHFLHGGDYNPDQWNHGVWEDDLRLMKEAHCNTMTVGVFSWVHLEPEEGVFTFDWLDEILDRLAENGCYAVLATPTAAPPAWMDQKYPEIRKMGPERMRRLHGNRVNQCWTSPIFREKCALIARQLATRYKDHPALILWHIYNEYGGACYCPLCEEAFREWLRVKFDNDLDRLNHAYWAKFWGHDYTDWSQIEAPGEPYGETAVMGLMLDWRRFVTDQVGACLRNEAAVLREISPDIPITTNMMGTFQGLNYWKHVGDLDVVSWDSYPAYHDRDEDWKVAAGVSFTHDIYRTFKGGKPWMLMESTPSSCNWMQVMKLKRPGIHRLASLQAVAHGADTVQYFQWRASRGAFEKFHGAVVSHDGTNQTRVFREVSEIGQTLEKLDSVIGTTTHAQVALIYDWENSWAIDGAQGPRKQHKDYTPTCMAHYRPFWQRGIAVDVVCEESDLTGYKVLVAPMLYLIKPGVAERIAAFVENGGTFVATYWSGIVDENDLCFLGGFPGPLRKVLGIWSEEIDALYEDETNQVRAVKDAEGNFAAGLFGQYEAKILCDLIHAEGADVLATYGQDFYAGRPALTVNRYGQGRAYYIAARTDDRLLDDLYGHIAQEARLETALDTRLPQGMTAQRRTDGTTDTLFLLNFTRTAQNVTLPEALTDAETGETVSGILTLAGYGARVLFRSTAS